MTATQLLAEAHHASERADQFTADVKTATDDEARGYAMRMADRFRRHAAALATDAAAMSLSAAGAPL